jgi:hypothetical protein
MKLTVRIGHCACILAGLCQPAFAARSSTASRQNVLALKGHVDTANSTSRQHRRAPDCSKQECKNLTIIAKYTHFIGALMSDLVETVQEPYVQGMSDVFVNVTALLNSAPPDKTVTKEAHLKSAKQQKLSKNASKKAAKVQAHLRKAADVLDGEQALRGKVANAAKVLTRAGLEKKGLKKLSDKFDDAASKASGVPVIQKNLSKSAEELRAVSKIFNVSDVLQGGDIATAVKELEKLKKESAKQNLSKMATDLRSAAEYVNVSQEKIEAGPTERIQKLASDFNVSILSMSKVDKTLSIASSVFMASLSLMVNDTVGLQKWIGCSLTAEDQSPSQFMLPEVCASLQDQKAELIEYSATVVPALQAKLNSAQKRLARAQSAGAENDCTFHNETGEVPVDNSHLVWCQKVTDLEEVIKQGQVAHSKWEQKLGRQMYILMKLMRKLGDKADMFDETTPHQIKEWTQEQYASIQRFLMLLKGVTTQRITRLSKASSGMYHLFGELLNIQANYQCRATDFDTKYDTKNCGVLKHSFKHHVSNLATILNATRDALQEQIQSLNKRLVEKNCVDPSSKPPGEGCWFKVPHGCPELVNPDLVKGTDIAAAHAWTKDKYGMQTVDSGGNSVVCLKGRKIQIDAYCGVNDTEMYFIPMKPTVPGCYFLTPEGCPKAEFRKEGLRKVWTKDTFLEASTPDYDKQACLARKDAWNEYCYVLDTEMLYVPRDAATGSMLAIDKDTDVVAAMMTNSTSMSSFEIAVDEDAMTAKVNQMMKDALDIKERMTTITKDIAKVKTAVENKDKQESESETDKAKLEPASAPAPAPPPAAPGTPPPTSLSDASNSLQSSLSGDRAEAEVDHGETAVVDAQSDKLEGALKESSAVDG